MREEIRYYAYDDTEFFDRAECEAYEKKAFDLLEEIFNSFEFLLNNGQEIQIFLNDVESGMNAFTYAWEKCDYIRVKGHLSYEATEFLGDYFGYDLPINEDLGLYEYDPMSGWIKIGE